MPSVMVVRDRPVAPATKLMPPCPKAIASAAAHSRRIRSFIDPRRRMYFVRIASSLVFLSILSSYLPHSICSTYFLTAPYVGMLERGENAPTVLVLHQLAQALKVSMTDIVGDVELGLADQKGSANNSGK